MLALTSMPLSDWGFARLVANESGPCTLRDRKDEEGIHGGHDSNSNTHSLTLGIRIVKLSTLLGVKTEVKHSNELSGTKTYNCSLH